MSDHNHVAYEEGCFRCDLSSEEVTATHADALRALAKQLSKVKGIPRAADVLTDLRHVIDNQATGGWGSDPHVVTVAELEALMSDTGGRDESVVATRSRGSRVRSRQRATEAGRAGGAEPEALARRRSAGERGR